jgi:hypothetical protein
MTPPRSPVVTERPRVFLSNVSKSARGVLLNGAMSSDDYG